MPVADSPAPTGSKLHQINAVLTGYKPLAERALTDAYHTLQRAPALSGLSRTYKPKDDEDEPLPAESTHVQVLVEDPDGSAPDVLSYVAGSIGKLLDLQLTQDATNAGAKADVVVDGEPLLRDVPVTYLLFLEKYLSDKMRALVGKVPALDASERWEYDVQRRCWVSEPAQTLKMRKVRKTHVLFEPTEHQPGQAEVYTEDEPRGTWTTYKLSGAVPAERARELRLRLNKLIEAVKVARGEANSAPVVQRTDAGQAVFDYLFAR